MLDLLSQYEFVRYTLAAGFVIGLIAPLMGIYLVVRRLSLIADALSHITLSGVATGFFLQKKWGGVNPLYIGMLFSLCGSLFVERIRRIYASYQELAIPILLSAGIGFGVVLIGITGGFNTDVVGYLFGSILLIGKEEFLLILLCGAVVLLFLSLFHKELFTLSFDEEYAITTGIPHRMIHVLFAILTALVIAVSMSVVGIFLVSSLMTIPVATSLQFTKGFYQTMIWSVIFSQISVWSGLIAAYAFDLSPGGTIVLSSLFLLFIVFIIKRLSGAVSQVGDSR